jgi:hypothetical protein
MSSSQSSRGRKDGKAGVESTNIHKRKALSSEARRKTLASKALVSDDSGTGNDFQDMRKKQKTEPSPESETTPTSAPTTTTTVTGELVSHLLKLLSSWCMLQTNYLIININ